MLLIGLDLEPDENGAYFSAQLEVISESRGRLHEILTTHRYNRLDISSV